MRRSLRRAATQGHRLPALLTATALLMATFGATAARARTGTAFVRVNQVGYVGTASKRAYLMASGSEAGATFKVKDSQGTTVYSAPIGANLGSWSTAYPFVYALDFGPVSTAGTYTIAVAGSIAATSPTFSVGTGDAVYSGAETNALSYYQNSRDGPDYIPSALRTAPGHLNDENAMTYLTPKVNGNGGFHGDLSPLGISIDASGAWWDAGDYPKFLETITYTVDLLMVGVRDFPAQMGAGSGSSDFTAEAKFGADWLLRMWDNPTRTLYYQVGIGEGNSKTVGDHDIWRLPQADDAYGGSDPLYRYIRNRPAFRAAPPGSLISPNLAGRDAAALALSYQLFKTSDPAFAKACLVAAEHIFDLADTAPSGDLLTVIPFDFYPETEWRSDLELGATELYYAVASGGGHLPGLAHSSTAFYLRKASHWAAAYIHGPDDAADTLNLYDVSGLAHDELYRAIGQAGNPAGLDVTKAALLADLKKQLDGAVTQAGTDPFGFGFPWASFDTTTHGAGLSVMASEYDNLTGTTAYAPYAGRWLGNILGANAWGTSLIVGDGSAFPDCMQHQVANLAGSLDGSPPVLAGAAVEGPNSFAATGVVSGMRACPPGGGDRFARFNGPTAVYQDNVQSWSTVEPALDLTASSPLAFAWQATGAPAGAATSTQTVVTIQFDDGNADQYQALSMLSAHGMHGTFYVNTGFIGDATHLSWAQLHDLATAGDEIAGHTLTHVDLKKLKPPDATYQVCQDRQNLIDNGFAPVSFAYPFGSFDAGTEQIVASCGYHSGRGVSGVNDQKVFAETMPPADPYATRTPANPKKGTKLAKIEGYVTAAEQNGGGWVQLVFHHICDGCDAYSISSANFQALLDWLQPRVADGTVVETTNQVVP